MAGGPGRGLATNVFQEPQAVAASAGRAVYVADGYVVRRLDTNSSWEGVTAGQGVPASPEGVAVDRSGDLVVGDGGNGRVRIVRS